MHNILLSVRKLCSLSWTCECAMKLEAQQMLIWIIRNYELQGEEKKNFEFHRKIWISFEFRYWRKIEISIKRYWCVDKKVFMEIYSLPRKRSKKTYEFANLCATIWNVNTCNVIEIYQFKSFLSHFCRCRWPISHSKVIPTFYRPFKSNLRNETKKNCFELLSICVFAIHKERVSCRKNE